MVFFNLLSRYVVYVLIKTSFVFPVVMYTCNHWLYCNNKNNDHTYLFHSINIWAATWDFKQYGACDQQRLRPACAVLSEPLLVTWIFYDYYATDGTSFGVSKLKRRQHRIVWVYSCQNATLLEITCRGSFVLYVWRCLITWPNDPVFKQPPLDLTNIRHKLLWSLSCAIPERFFRGSPTFFFFVLDEVIQIPLKAGHHRSASETPFQWRSAGVPMMAQHWKLAR